MKLFHPELLTDAYDVEAQKTGFGTFDANADQKMDYSEFKTMYKVSENVNQLHLT